MKTNTLILFAGILILAFTACKDDYKCCTTTTVTAPGFSSNAQECVVLTKASTDEVSNFETAGTSNSYNSATQENAVTTTYCNPQ